MLRRVDRWLGVPMTLALTAVAKAANWLRPSRPARAESILFVKLAEQGSTVLAYAALLRAVEKVGRDKVYFLAFDNNRFIVDALAVIPRDNVITINESSLWVAMLSSLKAVARLRSLSVSAAIDMEFFARSSAVFTFLSGAPLRVGLHRFAGGGAYRGDLMTHRLVYNPHLHTSQVFLSMVEALDYPASAFPTFALQVPALEALPTPLYQPSQAELDAVAAMLRATAGKDEVPPLILLNVNCSDLLPLRKWDTTNYIALAGRLLDNYPDLYIGFTGAPDEAEGAEEVAAAVNSPRCLNLAGKTSMEELLALYTLSRVLVTNDSGPAHFATLTPIQSLTLFGPETPKLFAANSPRSHTLWAGIACSPCVSAYNNRVSTCTDNVCMQRLSVDEVFSATCGLYENILATPIARAGRG